MRRSPTHLSILAIGALFLIGACSSSTPGASGGGGGGGGASTTDPVASVTTLVNLVKAKQFDQIPALVCAAKRNEIEANLNPAQAIASSVPGLNGQALLDAMTFDIQNFTATQTSKTDTDAKVAITGKLVINLDAAKARDFVKSMLTAQGQTNVSDSMIDAILPSITSELSKGTDIDTTVDVVNENGAWLVCGDITG